MTAKPRLLCVDDEPAIIEGLRLSLRKRYQLTGATSGAEGLAIFDEALSDPGQEPFDAVVSDMRMPEMNGVEFLTAILNRSPDTPRILLSGQADLESTIAAINDAKIFRFLTKPCEHAVLAETVDEAMELQRLRECERVLLDQTLRGTVSMLTEVLGLVSVTAYGRTMRVRDVVAQVSEVLDRQLSWDLDVATLLSQIGCVVVADAPGHDAKRTHGELAANLLQNIPRLEPIADIVRLQHESAPIVDANDVAAWTDDQLNAEILRAAVAYDAHFTECATKSAALKALAETPCPPPKFILDALKQFRPSSDDFVETSANVADLAPGMQLLNDLHATSGAKLAAEATTLTAVLIERIRGFANSAGVEEPIAVMAPRTSISRMRVPR